MSISTAQFQEMLARTEFNAGRVPKMSADPVEKESDLHDDIIGLCRARGWYYVHSRMDRATTQAKGVSDFVIALDGGVTVWIEAKAKRGKVTTEQLATIAHLKKLGHAAGIAYNMADVADLIVTAQVAAAEVRAGLESGRQLSEPGL